jgi:fluoride exporter
VRTVVLVAAGGALGSVLRYALGGIVQIRSGVLAFPLGTLAVNVIGCFAIGVVAELFEMRGATGSASRAFLTVGLLGGFTTFSAFSNETLNLLRDGEMFLAGVNVTATVMLCLAAVWAGRVAVELVWR